MEVGTISIRYGDLALIAQRLRSVKDAISMSADQTDLNFQLDACYRAEAYLAPLLSIKTDLARTVEEFESLAKLLDEVAAKCEEKERGIKTGLANIVAAEGFSGSTAPPPGHANEYYGGLDEAAAQKKKEDDDARDAEEKRKAKREAILAYFAERFPLAYAAYMEKVNAAADEAWLEELKNSDDPEDQAIYEMIMEQKKAEEEARKAAEALEESGGLPGSDGTLGDLGADLGLGGGEAVRGLGVHEEIACCGADGEAHQRDDDRDGIHGLLLAS